MSEELTTDDMFPGGFLKASDLGGALMPVTIDNVTQETLKGGETKWILHFIGDTKALVLNKTNASKIGEIHGKRAKEWHGKRIVLYPCEVAFQGKTVEAIRVKAPAVKKPTPQPAPQPQSPVHPAFDDDIPDYLPDDDVESAA